MDKKQHADRIEEAATALNQALRAGEKAGVFAKVEVHESRTVGQAFDAPHVTCRAFAKVN